MPLGHTLPRKTPRFRNVFIDLQNFISNAGNGSKNQYKRENIFGKVHKTSDTNTKCKILQERASISLFKTVRCLINIGSSSSLFVEILLH